MDNPTLSEVIMLGLAHDNFRMSATNEKVFINFGNEAYQFPRPSGLTMQRLLDVFSMPDVVNDDEVGPLKADLANYDG